MKDNKTSGPNFFARGGQWEKTPKNREKDKKQRKLEKHQIEKTRKLRKRESNQNFRSLKTI